MQVPRLTLADLKKELDELRGNYHDFKDDDLFTLWFLKAYVTGDEPLAAKSICGNGGDMRGMNYWLHCPTAQGMVLRGAFRPVG
jgi:hypothetical protein